MKHIRIATAGTIQTFVLVFDPGDDVVPTLVDFAKYESVEAARFSGVGGFASATLGYFDRAKLTYDPVELNEQMELLSIQGNLSMKDGAPWVHAHCVVGHRGGSVTGGHLLAGIVWPTLELFLDVFPTDLVRSAPPGLGYATIDVSLSP